MGTRSSNWADAALICCIVVFPAIAAAGLLIDPLPSSLRRPTGQYDATSKGEESKTTFTDGNVSVSIVNSTVGDPLVHIESNSSSPAQTSNQEATGAPSQNDIIAGGSDDMEGAASFFRPRGYGGYGGYGGGYGGGRRYGGYGGYSGGYGGGRYGRYGGNGWR